MSAIFDAYCEEFATLCSAAAQKISETGEQSGAARRAAQAEAEATLAKADELVQQMELEAKSSSGPTARELQKRAKASKTEVAALRTSLKQAASSVAARAELLGSTSSGDEAADDQRARLLRMGDRMQEGTSRLQQANRTIMETEELGANILGDLRSQRETLQHATGTLQRANEGLARSKRTLSAISRRAFENKLIMWGLILLLTAGIVLLLLFEAGAFSGSGEADEAGLPPPAPQKLRL